MSERKALSAVLSGKCPRCRKGDVFSHRTWNLKRFTSTHQQCPHCGLQYEQEPGFFYGAMYVSYAFSVGVFIGTVLLLYIFANDPDLIVYILSVALISAITYPINFRLSRLVMLYLFSGVRYDPAR